MYCHARRRETMKTKTAYRIDYNFDDFLPWNTNTCKTLALTCLP